MALPVTAWFVEHPEALAAMRADLASHHPQLHAFVVDELVVVRGTFALIDGEREVDRYELEILLPHDFPRTLPAVYETARRIPRVPERHTNHDGSLCLGVPEALWLQFGEMSLVQFLHGPVQAFLAANSYVEAGHQWPHGEWGHGTEGVLQFYAGELGVADASVLSELMRVLVQAEPKWQKACPCRSGRRLRECHAPAVRRLRDQIPNAVLSASLDALRSAEAGE